MDQRSYSHVVYCQPKVHRNDALILTAPAGCLVYHHVSEVVNLLSCRDVAEVAYGLVVEHLFNIIRDKKVRTAQDLRFPIGIEVHRGRKCPSSNHSFSMTGDGSLMIGPAVTTISIRRTASAGVSATVTSTPQRADISWGILSFLFGLWQWMLEQRFPAGPGRQKGTPIHLLATG